MELDRYRAEGEAFVGALDREYYLHFSGQKASFDVQEIYARHDALFSRESVDGLREAGAPPELLRFAVEGLLGQATQVEEAELARREAALEVEAGGQRLPYRRAAVVQANEPQAERRAELERARNAVVERELTPLLQQAHEKVAGLVEALGWSSSAAMSEELARIDLRGLGRRCQEFLDATDDVYERVVDGVLEGELGFGFDALRRSDLPFFFRARSLDRFFDERKLFASLEGTVAGLGVADGPGRHVRLDAEDRPSKSPRAFCAPVRVPDEVYLVIARQGGREDFETLFHEAGHAYHYAHVDRTLPFEARYLGDASVTEGYAFLFEHLCSDPAWLEEHLGARAAEEIAAHRRASKLVFLRRYAGKLLYELELHGEEPRTPDALRALYAQRLSDAVRVEWPEATFLADVDPFFYAARYLRAWMTETRLRALLRERYGPRWFADPSAGRLLAELWSEGQARPAEELLAGLGASDELDFGELVAELEPVG